MEKGLESIRKEIEDIVTNKYFIHAEQLPFAEELRISSNFDVSDIIGERFEMESENESIFIPEMDDLTRRFNALRDFEEELNRSKSSGSNPSRGENKKSRKSKKTKRTKKTKRAGKSTNKTQRH